MAIKYEKLQVGMVLWEIKSELVGNTTMRRLAKWTVEILELHPETRAATVSWNGNPGRKWYEGDLRKLYAKVPPKLQERMDRQRF